MTKSAGFTLIELMIVVAIIAVLAAIALPAYNSYILKGKLTEAFSLLSSYQLQMEQYFQDNRNYWLASDNTKCAVTPPTTGAQYFQYSCAPSADGLSYTATATGIATKGLGGFAYTVDQSGGKATVITAGAPSGWASNSGCWLRSSGGC
ncbi:MAG: prepilin-type N-terminal cleavage/methylation domain-containing protein [Proteobacteria bacterium]|nr:prepilin-type N-terminal cleavage/methylation domain-containing protein [Pseudomonadota bacterium]HQR03447.1 type IV pilin protein [Rhodocyclaceae bacterium]